MRKILLMVFSIMLAGAAAAQGDAGPSCPGKTVQSCAKLYRICLSSCPPHASFDQDECRYRCCVDNRSCLVGGGCDAAECGD